MAFTIAASVTIGLIVLFCLLRLILSTVRSNLQDQIRDRFPPEDILAATIRANFFGQQSKGGRQIRGNGALVLTRDTVYFLRAVPRKEYTIGMDAITAVSLPRSFNGKSILFYPLLCIHYTTCGGSDAMAFAVKKPDAWKAAIEKLVSAAGNGQSGQ